MPITVDISVSGLKEAQAVLGRLKKSLGDFRPELEAVGKELKSFYGRVPFETDGSIYGSRWAELSPRYERQKVKQYPGRGILERSGVMRSSFGFSTSAKFLELTNSAGYFDYHQADGARRRLPQRKMVVLSDLVRRSMLKTFVGHLVGRIVATVRK